MLKWKSIQYSYSLFGVPRIVTNGTNIEPSSGPFEKPAFRPLTITTGDERFPAEDVLCGTVIDRNRCADVPNGLWIEIEGRGDCVRYYAHGLSEGRNGQVLVYFSGDAVLRNTKGVRHVSQVYLATSPNNIQADMAAWSHDANAPAIFIARPGLHGSSGYHEERRQEREMALMDRALDLLKKRYAIGAYVLAGQSGGGQIVAALLSRRNDIKGAVMSSGLLAVKDVATHWEFQRDIPGRLLDPVDDFYDPIEDVESIPQEPAPQIYVISDPEDRSIPFRTQLAYVRSLRSAGLRPQHVYASAPAPAHHVLSGHAKRAAALIARGELPQGVRAALQELDWAELSRDDETPVVRRFERDAMPRIEAASAICARLPAGAPSKPDRDPEVLFTKSPDKVVPPASITKLMTAILSLEIADLRGMDLASTRLTVKESDVASGSGRNVDNDDQLILQDALANLLIPSSNTTANTMARVFGQILVEESADAGSDAMEAFVAAMNAKATELGMLNTQFRNPSGISARGQRSTARDIMKLAASAARYEAIADIWHHSTYEMNVLGPKSRKQLIKSSVKVSGEYDLLGAKTGTLLPGVYNIAALSEAPQGNRIVTVILRAPTEWALYTGLRSVQDAIKRGRKWEPDNALADW